MTIIFYNCDGNVAFSHAFYNSHVFTGWNKLLLYTFKSTVIISILSLYIPFSRYSKINFLREYQKGLSRRYCLLDFNVKVRGVGYIGYTNDFTPQQSQAWGRSCWSLIKLLVIVTLNKRGERYAFYQRNAFSFKNSNLFKTYLFWVFCKFLLKVK